MAEATEKLAQWHLKLSEFEFDIVHCAGLKHLAADAVSPFKTKGKDKYLLDDESAYLTILQEIFAGAPKTEISDSAFMEERKRPFGSFIPEVGIMAGIADNEKAKIPMLAVFITAQASDAHCRAAFTSVGKPSTHFDDDMDGVLV